MEDYSINISVKIVSNIPNETAEITNFNFSHYVYENCKLPLQRKQLDKKNITLVEDNVLSMYAKFQLNAPYGF